MDKIKYSNQKEITQELYYSIKDSKEVNQDYFFKHMLYELIDIIPVEELQKMFNFTVTNPLNPETERYYRLLGDEGKYWWFKRLLEQNLIEFKIEIEI